VTRVLTHRRDEHPIGKRQVSNRERIKQASHGQFSVISSQLSVACRAEARAKAGPFQ
jgi:hypothetical protein